MKHISVQDNGGFEITGFQDVDVYEDTEWNLDLFRNCQNMFIITG